MMNRYCGSSTAQAPYHGWPQPNQASAAISAPAVKVTQPAANTVRRMPQRTSSRRQAMVPRM